MKLLAALAAVLIGVSLARADGLIIVTPVEGSPVPVPDGHFPFAPLEVQQHHVTCTIKDQVAVTEVDQTFFNPTDRRLEGTYLFPLPKGGQIDQFAMDIGGKMVDAELLDAAKARGIYEGIVRRSKDPALLEYVGQGLFRARVFPIEPRSSKKIKLKYTQVLENNFGLVSYTYPLNTEKFSAAPIKSVSIKIDLASGKPIKSIYSPSHNIDVKRKGENAATVGFETMGAKPDTDFQLYYSVPRDKNADIDASVLAFHDGDKEGGYFMMLAAAPTNVDDERIARKDVVFVLDTSGSMNGEKMEQARRALSYCVNNLNAGDRFEVVRFSTEAEPLFGSLTPADQEHVEKAQAFIKELKAAGGTAIDEAMTRAVETVKGRAGADAARPCVVIFITDGRPTIGPTDTDEIVGSMKKSLGDRMVRGVRVFSWGIGTDVNTHLLDRIAAETRAFSQYVLPEEDIEVKLSNFYSKISNPILANLKLDFTNVKVSKVYPSALPDLFEGDQLIVVGRYTGGGDAAIVLEGTVNGSPRKLTFETEFPENTTEHAFVPKLWATRRVGYLLEEIRLRGESAELRDEVTRLARQYGIATPYTAYLIVEDEDRRRLSMGDRSVPLPATAAPAAREQLADSYRSFSKSDSGGKAVAGSVANEAMKQAHNVARDEEDAKMAELAIRGTDARLTEGGSSAFGGGSGAGRAGARTEASGEERAAQAAATQAVIRARNQQRFIRNRTFYQNGSNWIDASVAQHQDAKRVKVEFGSDAYFALMKKHPDAPAWLSVGPNVTLFIDGTIYEVVDES